MFELSQRAYDALYADKDYAGEAAWIDAAIRHRRPDAATLLDVACGTGRHLEHLSSLYVCEGLDLNKGLVEIARTRLPGVPFHVGDMTAFDLGRTFDVVTCLFSSIGMVDGVDAMRAGIGCMARHVSPGGALLVEPWLPVEWFEEGHIGLHVGERVDLKVARMNDSHMNGRVWVMTFHYLVGSADGIEHFTEEARLTSFTEDEYVRAFEDVGLRAAWDEQGPSGRGMWIGARA